MLDFNLGSIFSCAFTGNTAPQLPHPAGKDLEEKPLELLFWSWVSVSSADLRNFKQKSCFEILFVTSLFPCKSQLVGNLLMGWCMLCLTVLTSPSTSLAPWQIFFIKNESDFDKANEHAVYRDLASFQRPSQKKWAGNVFLSSLVRQPEVRWGNLIWGNMGEIIWNTRKGNWWRSQGCANLKAGVKGAGMVNDHVAQLPGWRNLCYILGDININIIWKAWDLGWSVKHF